MNGSMFFFFMDELLPAGKSGGGGNGCGCAALLVVVVIMALVKSCCSFIYTSCSNSKEEHRKEKEMEQQMQRLQDFNESLSTTYFWEFAEQALELEGFFDAKIHDTYVVKKYTTSFVTSSESYEFIDFPYEYLLEGDFHMDEDTTHYFFELYMRYDYEKDKNHELKPECWQMTVSKYDIGYKDQIFYRFHKDCPMLVDEPYDSILEARKARCPLKRKSKEQSNDV